MKTTTLTRTSQLTSAVRHARSSASRGYGAASPASVDATAPRATIMSRVFARAMARRTWAVASRTCFTGAST